MTKEISSIQGPGGLPMLAIENQHAQALVSLYGGHLLSFHPRGEEEILFTSSKSQYERGQPIRGGVPVCWPWFGQHATDKSKPMHGFARLSEWTLKDTETTHDGATRIELELHETPHSMALWPHPFRLTLIIIVGMSASLELQAENRSNEEVVLTGALHTYLNVAEARDTHITGLDDTFYADSLAEQRVNLQRGKLIVNEEINRIYRETGNTCILHDPGFGRQLVVKKSGSRSTVIWNPWIERAAALPDLGDEDYRRMVCIEAANTIYDAVHLAPGASHVLATEIGLISYGAILPPL
jgi:D-hexose-6-phosphate mutarotase